MGKTPAALRLPPDEWFAAARYEVRDEGHETPCWMWLLARTQGGYGRCGWGTDGETFFALAHRLYWQRENGAVPEGMDLDHLCRRRACVNPAHLEAVSRRVNLRRGRMSRRLTAAQVVEIRESGARGVDLAARFGVTPTTISHVRALKTWKELWPEVAR